MARAADVLRGERGMLEALAERLVRERVLEADLHSEQGWFISQKFAMNRGEGGKA